MGRRSSVRMPADEPSRLAAMSVVPVNPSGVRPPVAPVTVIRPSTGWATPRVAEAWAERELLYYFVARDVKVRYAQTLLGAFWAFFQPIGMMLVFTLAFQKLGRVSAEGVPYPIFVFTGLTFWTFFSRAIMVGADSLVANAPLLTKSPLPRLLLPLASIFSALFDFLITFSIMIVIAGLYGRYPTWRYALAPVVMVVGITLAIGLTLLLCAVNVRYRDVRNILPTFVQVMLFASPVLYSLTTLGPHWSHVLDALNPVVGIVQGFRWSIIGTGPPSHVAIVSSLAFSAVLLAAGLAYFGRVERLFADVA
jgi:lipopolysaccharide transport system permease protein